eukprot:210530-Alexandrium_andersonii.AAC.1
MVATEVARPRDRPQHSPHTACLQESAREVQANPGLNYRMSLPPKRVEGAALQATSTGGITPTASYHGQVSGLKHRSNWPKASVRLTNYMASDCCGDFLIKAHSEHLSQKTNDLKKPARPKRPTSLVFAV